MITNFLEQAFKQKKLISITTKSIEWDESIIGYVTETGNAYFTMNEINAEGDFIGKTVFSIDEVLCVQPDDFYLREIQIIHQNRDVFNPDLRVTVWKKGKDLLSYFKKIKNENKITRFFFEDDNYVIGIVLDYNDDFFVIKNIGENGLEEGISCYKLNDSLIGLRYDGLAEQKIKLLYKKENKYQYDHTEIDFSQSKDKKK